MVDVADVVGDTPLHLAAKKGLVPVLAALIANGASVNVASTKGNTPLHYATYDGLVAIIEVLVAEGAAVDAVNYKTPLALLEGRRLSVAEIARIKQLLK